jgi:hypothetical protein
MKEMAIRETILPWLVSCHVMQISVYLQVSIWRKIDDRMKGDLFLGEFFLHYCGSSVYLDKEKPEYLGVLGRRLGSSMPTANTSCGFHESQDCGIKSPGNSSLAFSASIFISRSAIICRETLSVQPCAALRGLDSRALSL